MTSTPQSDSSCAKIGVTADRVVNDLRRLLAKEPGVACVYLYGSMVKGRTRASSDVDVAILFSEAGNAVARAERCLELEGQLEAALGRSVQVVSLSHAALELEHNVLGHGRLVLSNDEASRVRHYVDHARRYYDMAHARQVFDRYRARRIEEGSFGGGSRDGT